MWFASGFCFILPSCQGGRTSALQSEEVPMVAVKEDPNRIFCVDSIATLSHLVALESVEESLIGSIDKLFIAENRVFILDQKRDRLLSFSVDGSFICQIGIKGNGPQEYASLTDVSFDPKTNQLFLWDRIKSSMFIYSTDGKLMGIRHSNYSANSLTVFEDQVYLYFPLEQKAKNFDVISVDSSMQRMHNGFLPKKNLSLPAMLKPCFVEENGGRYFCSMYSNTLFRVDKRGLMPYVRLDFGCKEVPYDNLLKGRSQSIEETIGQGAHLGHVSGMHVSDSLCFFSFDEILGNAYGKHYLGIINNKSHNVETFGMIAGSPLLVDQSNLLYITDDQQLVYAIFPERYNPIYYDNLRNYYPDVSPDDNPILAFYDLKR